MVPDYSQSDVLRAIARISASFIAGKPEEVDSSIERALADLAELVGANRSSLFSFDLDTGRAGNTHEWCKSADDSQIELLRDIPVETFGYYYELLIQGQPVQIGCLDDLPEQAADERAWSAEHGFRPLLFTPILAGNKLVGALGFYGSVGEERTWPPRTTPLLQIVGDICYSAIISQRAALAQREIESTYRTLVETCPDAIALTTLDGTIVKVNSRGPEIYGVDSVDDMIGINAFELVAPEDRERARKNIQRRSHDNPGSVAYTLQRADGRTFPGEIGASPVFDGDGAPWGVVAVVRDVSARVRMESQLQQASRMASLGTLAAGVAHEINNPLTYVMISLQRLNDSLPKLAAVDPGQLSRLVNSASASIEGVERIAAIVRDLKTFSHVESEETAPCRVEDILDKTIALAAHQFRNRAELVTDYGETPAIRVNSSRLSQVFLNLLINAAHAIEEGDYASNQVRVSTRAQDGGVVVEIRDTGCGIPPRIRDRLFDPFFTTKPIGVGSGLGLSICAGIIAAHDGTIEVESSVGEGAMFRVRLPAAATHL